MSVLISPSISNLAIHQSLSYRQGKSLPNCLPFGPEIQLEFARPPKSIGLCREGTRFLSEAEPMLKHFIS